MKLATMQSQPADQVSNTQVLLKLSGMTCTSCASRIGRKLNKIPGVTASVNFATEEATVAYDQSATNVDALITAVREAGYDASIAGEEKRLNPVWAWWQLAFAAAASLFLLAAGLGVISLPRFPQLLLALAVMVVPGRVFFKAAFSALRQGSTSMDTLVALGSGTAFTFSAIVTIAGLNRQPTFFDTASIIVSAIYLGKLLEAKAKGTARDALSELKRMAASPVTVLGDEGESTVPMAAVLPGDRLVVRPGDLVPADGTVVEGDTWLDESVVTGESLPIRVAVGGSVIGGSINRGSRIVVAATSVGSATLLGQVADLVVEAQGRKASLERLADRISAVFVPAVIGLALVVFGVRLATASGLGTAIATAVAVLVVACPCALGLATPTSFLVGTSRAAREGILIRSPEVLEHVGKVDTVVFDKTGTITTGALLADPSALTPEELARAGSLAEFSNHPVSRAIANAFGQAGGTPLPVDDASEIPGAAIVGEVTGERVEIGSASYFGLPDPPFQATFVRVGDGAVRAVPLSDQIRDGAREAISQLARAGLHLVLLTGDSEAHAREIAGAVGIGDVRFGVKPASKAEAIAAMEAAGSRVAMVGDGSNDSGALAVATLGIALASGTDLAKASADITLVGSKLSGIWRALALSQATLRNIKQNLGWAFGYNLIAIPLAATGQLSPMLAAVMMSSSSVIVVVNALRLRRFRLQPRS